MPRDDLDHPIARDLRKEVANVRTQVPRRAVLDDSEHLRERATTIPVRYSTEGSWEAVNFLHERLSQKNVKERSLHDSVVEGSDDDRTRLLARAWDLDSNLRREYESSPGKASGDALEIATRVGSVFFYEIPRSFVVRP